MTATDTAHEHWDRNWKTEEGRAGWTAPDPLALSVSERLRAKGARRALDVGAGVGRHALALARLGYETVALDASAAGLEQIEQSASAGGLTVETRQGMMDRLPFDEASFDLLVSWNVIYHGDRDVVARTLAGFRRVLKPGGTLVFTMLSKRNAHYGKGEEISPGAFVVADATDDKVHPHFYCSAAELLSLLEGFEVFLLEDVEQRPTHWHWQIVAERL